MSLSVAQVKNPTFTGLGSAPKVTIKGGTAINATPGSNGFITLAKPAAPAVAPAPANIPPPVDYAALLRAAQTPVPRFINFDTGAAWNKARDMATQAVSPRYQQMMTDFINKQQVDLARQQADTVSGKQTLDQQLAQNLADTQLQRTRTSEDTTNDITDINAGQAAAEQSGGLSYDSASRALTEGLAGAGLGESGLGQGQVSEAKKSYDMQSNEQLRQSTNKVEAAHTLMNRTFQDLGTSDTRNTEGTTQKKGQLDLDLSRFIEDQNTARTQEQQQEEYAKQGDIASASITNEGQLVDQWLASLRGQGYTAQEIANAASIYKT